MGNSNDFRKLNGAPEEIRTPDPQIRSLVLYPAELRVRRALKLPAFYGARIAYPSAAGKRRMARPGEQVMAKEGKSKLGIGKIPLLTPDRPALAFPLKALHQP